MIRIINIADYLNYITPGMKICFDYYFPETMFERDKIARFEKIV